MSTKTAKKTEVGRLLHKWTRYSKDEHDPDLLVRSCVKCGLTERRRRHYKFRGGYPVSIYSRNGKEICRGHKVPFGCTKTGLAVDCLMFHI